jgi:hypothetical protein
MPSTWREEAAQLGHALDALSRDEALDAVAALEGLKTRALRVALQPEASALMTVEEAADVAGVPCRRVRSWARGKTWARRISKRTLRIDTQGFRAWLGRADRT